MPVNHYTRAVDRFLSPLFCHYHRYCQSFCVSKFQVFSFSSFPPREGEEEKSNCSPALKIDRKLVYR